MGADNDDRPRARLLVADDDDTTREQLAAMLRERGHDVEAIADAHEAVARVSRGGIDLVILDANMQGPLGLEACRMIKGVAQERYVAVLLATVRTDPTSRIEGVKIGADDYVCKPIEASELVARVDACLRVKRLYDDMQSARETLERVSAMDELTGAYTYRYLHARLADDFRRAELHHEPLACCLLDIDRLKAHNEQGGRAFGDRILRGVTECVKKSLRESDAVARYGGDELLLVLPATHFAGSLSVAERIHAEVSARVFESKEGPQRVSVSMGVALFPSRDVRDKDALLRATDAALLQAKREGGGRVCVFQQQGFVLSQAERGSESAPPRSRGV